MTDKWIGPRVLCGDSNPPPDGYEYVRRYADDVRLAAGSGTTVENENVAGYVAFRRDWMRRHGLRAERCSLVDVTGDSMKWSALHFMLNGKRTVMESWSAPALRTQPAGPESLTISIRSPLRHSMTRGEQQWGFLTQAVRVRERAGTRSMNVLRHSSHT